MSDVFAGVSASGRAVEYLESVLTSGRATHAYLIVGDTASGADELALRFAAALVADGDAEQFALACHKAHPDLHLYEPDGAGDYLIEQIRGIIYDAQLAPVRSMRKVYLLRRAESLRDKPANAFLKTLEEPPEDVICILVARAERAVLETLRSRCEVVVLDSTAERVEGDAEVFGMLEALAGRCDNRTLLSHAKRFVERAHDAGQAAASAQEQQRDREREFLADKTARELQEKDRRQSTMRLRQALNAQLSQMRSWLRDCLLVQQGAAELCSYPSCADAVLLVATSVGPKALLDALDAIESCSQRISYNVSPQLAVEAMFIEIREALCQQ